jgi:hypothetical protein
MAALRQSLRGPLALHGILIVLCMVFGAAMSFTRGQDINFDQLNYHYYSAYAYETNRLGQDVSPAPIMHSYFSPYIYVPFYWMVQHWPPRLVGLGLGALHGLNLWLVFIIARLVTPVLPETYRVLVIVAAVVISGASPMTISELGTSMADLLISLPVLAGLALLMQARFEDRGTARTAAVIGLAGALVGAATSLKLTGASFAIGLGVASLVGWTSWRHRITALLATGLGGVVGFAIGGGAWYLNLWRRFGNPVFPYYNTVFRSPDYPTDHALFDPHYLPHGVLDALRYPFLWIRARTVTTEVAFRDTRFAMLIVLGAGAIAIWPIMRRVSATVPERSTPAGRRLLTFMIVAFCFWIYEWAIQRYLVSLELLMGPAIVVVLRWGGLFDVVRGRALAALAVLGAALCVATVHVPNWGHIGWRQSWYQVDPPPNAAPHPLYFLASQPLGFIVPYLPPGSSAVGVVNWEDMPAWGDTVFLRRIHALLADPQTGPIWAVSADPIPDSFRARMAVYGLKFDGACQTIKSRPWPITWCPLVRTDAAGHA